MKNRLVLFMVALIIISLCMGGCTSQTKPDVALMEFPGVKWNSTPEEVIAALKLTNDQIIENAMAIPDEDETTKYDIWNLLQNDLVLRWGK